VTQSGAEQEEAIRLDALAEIERQVLWLSTAMVHYANRVRPNPSGLKVGGHQASSASMVSIMTSLWFGYLRAEDRVSVKPHASTPCRIPSTSGCCAATPTNCAAGCRKATSASPL
jgi:pyruvate dehydrogenase complex dehydrogenase (E1) component